jgi:uncharacterized cupin superfamily protein
MPEATADTWFVVNATELTWNATPGWGRFVDFDRPNARFRDYGVNIYVLEPGEISTMYHHEDGQEGFLVLSGSPTLIVEGEERGLKAWDYVHCPAGTGHAFANPGEEPAAILMTGARDGSGRTPDTVYPVEPAAARHGASVKAETTDSEEAYAGTPDGADELYRRGTLPGA